MYMNILSYFPMLMKCIKSTDHLDEIFTNELRNNTFDKKGNFGK